MDTRISVIFFAAAAFLQYLTVYLAYLPVSWKYAPQGQMFKTSLLVTAFSMLAGILAGIIGMSGSVAIPITAVMVHQMGRRKLQQSNKQAWASAGIFIGIYLLLIIGVVCFLVHNPEALDYLLRIAG
jgi:D-alanyl-lipoteichoic acid acyltransferase DltB (MBOAT superfamily)